MSEYIVGTKRNPVNESAITHFYIWSLWETNVTEMDYTSLKKYLADNPSSIANAKLDFPKICGKQYSLDDLPYKFNSDSYNIDKYLIIELDVNDYVKVRFDFDWVTCTGTCTKELIGLQSENKLINCPKHIKNIVDNDKKELEARQKEKEQQLAKLNNMGNLSEEEKLLREAYDKNVVWDLVKFDKFMQLKNWKYSLYRIRMCNRRTLYGIRNVDKDCEVLHLPECVVESISLFEAKPEHLDTIIFPGGFSRLRNMYSVSIEDESNHLAYVGNGTKLNMEIDRSNKHSVDQTTYQKIQDYIPEYVDINNVYFQETPDWFRVVNESEESEHRRIIMHGLSYLNIKGESEYPTNHFDLISGIYNYCKFAQMPRPARTSTEARYELQHSFNHIETASDIDVIELTHRYYYKSYRGIAVSNLNTKLIIGPFTRDMQQCIEDTNIKELSFLHAQMLRTCTTGFSGLSEVETIDFSVVNTKVDSVCGESFFDCPKLKQIILPKSCRMLRGNNGKRSPLLKRLEIPEDIQIISGAPLINGGDVIYPARIGDTLRNEDMHAFKTAKDFNPIFQSEIKVLDAQLSRAEGSFEDLKIPKTVERLSFSVFENSSLRFFDSKDVPNVSEIPFSAFKDSLIQTVVLRDNIKYVGANIFELCEYIETVILDEHIEKFESPLFKGAIPDGQVKVYVVKGSPAAKAVRKSQKYIVIYVNNIQEACDIELTQTTSENKQAKFDMILADTPYKSLLEDKYRDNVAYLYALIKALEDNEPYMQDEIVLDTSKFMQLPIEDVPAMQEAHNEAVRLAIANGNTLGETRRSFAGLCNFVTKVSDNYTDFFNAKFIETLNNLLELHYGPSVIYIDEVNSISIVTLQRGSNISCKLLVIVQDLNIVFVTPFNISNYQIIDDVCGYSLFDLHGYSTLDTKIGLGTLLIAGDRLQTNYYSTYCINGKSIPTEFKDMLLTSLSRTCKLVGVKDLDKKREQFVKIIQTENRNSGNPPTADVLLYETLNARFIECAVALSLQSSVRGAYITEIYPQTVRGVYKLDEIGKIDVKYKQLIDDCFNNEMNIQRFRELLINDETKAEMRKDINNYDTSGDASITYTGELIYQNQIKSVDELAANGAILKRVLDCHLYENANISMNYIKKYENIYQRNILKPLGRNGEILMEFHGQTTNDEIYIAGLANGSTTMSSKKFLVGSLASLQSNIHLLYNIGLRRSSQKEPIHQGIDNEHIDASDFCFVATVSAKRFHYNGMKIHLAVESFSGDSYILGDIWDSSFYKLFRVKSFKHAIWMFNFFKKELREDHEEILSVLKQIESISNGYDVLYDDEIRNPLWHLRQDVINGFPNNMPYTNDRARPFIKMMDVLAKQPKEPLN